MSFDESSEATATATAAAVKEEQRRRRVYESQFNRPYPTNSAVLLRTPTPAPVLPQRSTSRPSSFRSSTNNNNNDDDDTQSNADDEEDEIMTPTRNRKVAYTSLSSLTTFDMKNNDHGPYLSSSHNVMPSLDQVTPSSSANTSLDLQQQALEETLGVGRGNSPAKSSSTSPGLQKKLFEEGDPSPTTTAAAKETDQQSRTTPATPPNSAMLLKRPKSRHWFYPITSAQKAQQERLQHLHEFQQQQEEEAQSGNSKKNKRSLGKSKWENQPLFSSQQQSLYLYIDDYQETTFDRIVESLYGNSRLEAILIHRNRPTLPGDTNHHKNQNYKSTAELVCLLQAIHCLPNLQHLACWNMTNDNVKALTSLPPRLNRFHLHMAPGHSPTPPKGNLLPRLFQLKHLTHVLLESQESFSLTPLLGLQPQDDSVTKATSTSRKAAASTSRTAASSPSSLDKQQQQRQRQQTEQQNEQEQPSATSFPPPLAIQISAPEESSSTLVFTQAHMDDLVRILQQHSSTKDSDNDKNPVLDRLKSLDLQIALTASGAAQLCLALEHNTTLRELLFSFAPSPQTLSPTKIQSSSTAPTTASTPQEEWLVVLPALTQLIRSNPTLQRLVNKESSHTVVPNNCIGAVDQVLQALHTNYNLTELSLFQEDPVFWMAKEALLKRNETCHALSSWQDMWTSSCAVASEYTIPSS